MESTRFPGKPLARICGHTMIEHVLKRTQLSKTLTDVVVATCNEEIIREVERAGGRAVMTKNTHERCTDRIEEAADKVGGDIVVNIQGDEPFATPEMIDLAVQAMLDDPTLVATVPDPLRSETLEDGVSGLLFTHDDEAGIANALRRLIGDASLRSSLGASGHASIGKRHAPAAVADSVVKLYAELAPS